MEFPLISKISRPQNHSGKPIEIGLSPNLENQWYKDSSGPSFSPQWFSTLWIYFIRFSCINDASNIFPFLKNMLNSCDIIILGGLNEILHWNKNNVQCSIRSSYRQVLTGIKFIQTRHCKNTDRFKWSCTKINGNFLSLLLLDLVQVKQLWSSEIA